MDVYLVDVSFGAQYIYQYKRKVSLKKINVASETEESFVIKRDRYGDLQT